MPDVPPNVRFGGKADIAGRSKAKMSAEIEITPGGIIRCFCGQSISEYCEHESRLSRVVPACFMPRGNGVEARQRTVDIHAGTYLRSGSSRFSCEGGLRRNPRHQVQAAGE
jgi:hypothetical protein